MVDEVARSWASVLDREVDIDQHLFDDLGAESIDVLELLDVMSEQFGVFLTVEQLYAHPTARLAAALLESVGANAG